MQQLIPTLFQRISTQMPSLALIDEDYGQLDFTNSGDSYPVTFPCVLLGNLEADWQHISPSEQKGLATITAKLAIDCYDDTHLGSGTEHRIAQRADLANQLYQALQAFCPLPRQMTPLDRIKTQYYHLPGGIKVYQHIFTFRIQQ